MPTLHDLARITCIGLGATALMDLWGWTLARLGLPSMKMALIGRWIGHGLRGTWTHEAIGKAAPVRGEALLGVFVHYATGVAFAGLLVALAGTAWLTHPTAWPALAVGAVTVIAPWCVMQPAMGAGFMSSRTASPRRNAFKSLVSHTVFGTGLYLAAVLARFLP